jgi:NAD(P)-dependent dehydrogenase (short-subunit alcohol dehydrogenase family)
MDPTRAAHAAVALLEALVEDRSLLLDLDEDTAKRLMVAAGRFSRPDKHARARLGRARRRRDRADERDADRALLAQAGIRQMRENPIFQTPRRTGAPPPPPLGEVGEDRVCYICRARTRVVHGFYDQLCLTCGDLNWEKRNQTADLSGRVALLTGGRVKIGFQAGVMLLRAGARLVVVTRFPVDAADRYRREPDFDTWGHRLEVHGVDLRHTPSVEALCARLLDTLPRLDFLINNACQTVRRPPAFYAHMLRRELEAPDDPQVAGLVGTRRESPLPASAALTQVPLIAEDRLEDATALFPRDRLDADLQQVDLRDQNSWRLQAHEVSTVELLEVHLVNAVAPFILNARLKPLMSAVPTADKHIVNVSAMEGQFYRTYKSDRHPHTNMAKASLNMLTRTSAQDYIQHGIHMNSVDTGWVTDEDPDHHARAKREMHDFHPPLDIVDGAARILDPIFHGIRTGAHVWGQFLKDYQVTDW